MNQPKHVDQSHAHLRRRGQRRTRLGCAPVFAVVVICVLSYCLVLFLDFWR